jgi:hypothetical protein
MPEDGRWDLTQRVRNNQKGAEQTPVSGPMCTNKAKVFYEALVLIGTISAKTWNS